MRKADLQPDSDVGPDRITVDEAVSHVDDERHLLYAVVDLETSGSASYERFRRS